MSDQRSLTEARLESVLDTAVDAIIVIDDHGLILSFNKACEALFGYSAREAIGQNVKMLMPEDYRVQHDDYMHNYMKTGERQIIGIGREVKGQHKSGRQFPAELSVGEARTSDTRQFIGIIRDISARKASEQRIAELQSQLIKMARVSAIDEMGATIAHELNQPLTAVMLYLQAAEKKLSTAGSVVDPKIGELVGKGSAEARRASDIIQRMRSFIERREVTMSSTNLRELADEAIDLTLLGHNAKRIRVITDDRDGDVDVMVDRVQIQQIVVNLVRNAVQVIQLQESPIITTRCYRDNEWAVLSIEDNGPGVPRHQYESMFRAFSGNRVGGIGLGLAISRSIAQNHGGDLSVDPGGKNRGARFDLRLPISAKNVSQAAE